MNSIQPGVLAAVPPIARYLSFKLLPQARPARALRRLAQIADGANCVVGLGASAASALGKRLDGLGRFPTYRVHGVATPSTPAGLWCWLRGKDPGDLLHLGREIEAAVADGFRLERAVEAFRHREGRDLTGYVDGTENPRGASAVAAAALSGAGRGLDGSSFVAVQQWRHDLDRFQSMSVGEQDKSIGRRRRDNVELARAPDAAHVKRTAQESFTPEAFVLRRSMPWAQANQAGLMFVAFGRSTAAFAAQFRRMAGAEDGIVDALFKFTQPISGAYYWCPPMRRGRLDWSHVLR